MVNSKPSYTKYISIRYTTTITTTIFFAFSEFSFRIFPFQTEKDASHISITHAFHCNDSLFNAVFSGCLVYFQKMLPDGVLQKHDLIQSIFMDLRQPTLPAPPKLPGPSVQARPCRWALQHEHSSRLPVRPECLLQRHWLSWQ